MATPVLESKELVKAKVSPGGTTEKTVHPGVPALPGKTDDVLGFTHIYHPEGAQDNLAMNFSPEGQGDTRKSHKVRE